MDIFPIHNMILYIGSFQSFEYLSLKAPITTAAEDKFCDTSPNFRQK